MQERVKSAGPKTSKQATKKTKVTLELDAALVTAAAVKGVDLAATLERALQADLLGGQVLSGDDRAAIDFHNRYEAEHGSWSDGLEKR